jgi:hypothetical protein
VHPQTSAGLPEPPNCLYATSAGLVPMLYLPSSAAYRLKLGSGGIPLYGEAALEMK